MVADPLIFRFIDRRRLNLFLRVTWEPFEAKFKPLEERFMHHVLVVVRTANVEHLIRGYQSEEKSNSREAGEYLRN